MAGTNPSFDTDAFRSAIEFAMTMGAPNETEERVKFIFRSENVYDDDTSPTGNPYSWDATPVDTTGSDSEVIIPIAMEFVQRSSQSRDTSLGFMQPSHVRVFVMDTYIDQVRGASELEIDGNRYFIRSWAPPVGLFDFTLYEVLAEAVDES